MFRRTKPVAASPVFPEQEEAAHAGMIASFDAASERLRLRREVANLRQFDLYDRARQVLIKAAVRAPKKAQREEYAAYLDSMRDWHRAGGRLDLVAYDAALHAQLVAEGLA